MAEDMPDEIDLLEDSAIIGDEEIKEEEVKEEEQEEEIKEEDKEEIKEDDEDEEKEEEDDEDEPVKIPFDRPSFKEIKAKYPEFFKDFPALKEAFFREAEFTKFFPTIDDAKEAFEDNEAFNGLRESVLSGDANTLLEAIEKAGKTELSHFTHSFLPSLFKRDQRLYNEVVTPLFESLIRHVFSDGNRNNNEDLKNAATAISKYLWGTSGVAEGKERVSKVPEAPKEDAQKKRENEERFNTVYVDVLTKMHKAATQIIMKDLDPEEVFTPSMRRLLAKDILERVGKQLEADEGHLSVMRARWKRASIDGFTDASKEKIITAYLSRAKSVIPSIREKVRTKALGGQERATKKPIVHQKEITNGRPSSSKPSRGPVDYKKMSDLDILGTE